MSASQPPDSTDELARPDALIGARLGSRWEVQKHLFSDGLGRVYTARDGDTGSTVHALAFHPHLTRSRAFVDGFEAALGPAAEIKHPNALSLVGHGVERLEGEWTAYQISRPFDGRTVVETVRRRGMLSVKTAVQIALEALDALNEAHSHGAIHGDLCPERVLVALDESGDARVKVGGFGVARLAADVIPPIGYGPMASGPPYWSPERARGEPASPDMDVYALGAVLYELLTGTPPFESLSPMEQLRLRTEQAPEPPSRRAPDRNIPSIVDDVVLQALAIDRTARFDDTASVYRALTQASEAVPTDEPIPTSGAPAMLGRTAQLKLIRELAEQPAEGNRFGKGILLLGEAGIGKSTMARAVAEELRGGPIRPVALDARAGNSATFGPFIELLRSVLGISRGAGPKVLKAAGDALERLGLDPLDVERILDVTSARPPVRLLAPEVAFREESMALRHAIEALLDASPSLLIIDDGDALDPASRRLAGEVVARAAGRSYGVLMTARYDPWPEWKPRHIKRVELEPMSDGDAALLAKSVLGEQAPAGLIEAATRSGRGSPWLLALRARAARDRTSDARALPDTPSGLIKRILDAAASPVRRWLVGAALFGKRAPMALLDQWAPTSGTREELVKGCLATGLVRREGETFVFESEGTRLAVEATVSPTDAREIHRTFSRWLSSGEPPRGEPPTIARHLFAAGDVAGAASRFEQAGRELLLRRDGRMAAQLFGSARSAWNELERPLAAARAGLSASEGQLLAGDTHAAEQSLSMASTELRSVSASTNETEQQKLQVLWGVALRVEARIRKSQKRVDEAIALLEEAVDRVQVGGLRREWFDVETDLADALFSEDRSEEAKEHALKAIEIAEELDQPIDEEELLISGPPPPTGVSVANALCQLGRIEGGLGRSGHAAAAFESASKEAAMRGNETAGARALANLAHVLAKSENDDGATEKARAAMALATRVGDRDGAARIALNLGTYRLRLGDDGGAAEAFKEARRLSAAIGWTEGLRLAKEATLMVTR